MTNRQYPKVAKEDIAGIECRFVVHCGKPKGTDHDIHMVKEVIHTKSGAQVPNIRFIKDYKRPIYVTKKGCQNHEQWKEWEDLDKVDKFMSTQSDLQRNIAKALGTPWFRGKPKELARSPYLYGTDILSTALIKHDYATKWPTLVTPYSVAAFDTERDVVYGTDQINMATISFKERVYTAVQKSFFKGISLPIEQCQAALIKYLGEYVTKRNITWELVLVDSEAEVVTGCINKAHEWQPDILSIWNIDYDIPIALKALENAGMPADLVFSDPRVPPEYRNCEYKQGPSTKKTSSGKESPMPPQDRWHTLIAPASFYVVDSMCAYRKIRIAKPAEAFYKLDYIMMQNLGVRKLKFKEAEGFEGIEWHQFMQEYYKVEYVIYNVFDAIGLEELDEHTKDLQLAFPMQAESSDFANFKSQPRRTVDKLHHFALEHNKVFASTSDEMANDLDKLTVDGKEWIVMLDPHLLVENGLKCIAEAPDLVTNIQVHCGDVDVTAAYPNNGICGNMSKATTKKEIVSIEGVSTSMMRAQSMNLSGGHTNAVEVASNLLLLPNMETMLDAFKKHLEAA